MKRRKRYSEYFLALDSFNESWSIIKCKNSLTFFSNFYMQFITDHNSLKASKAIKYVFRKMFFVASLVLLQIELWFEKLFTM